jgi:hypothetical protein
MPLSHICKPLPLEFNGFGYRNDMQKYDIWSLRRPLCRVMRYDDSFDRFGRITNPKVLADLFYFNFSLETCRQHRN